MRDTSFEGVGDWYDGIVGKEGHYYHEHVAIPGLLKLLDLKKGSSLLDLGCGQGVLARALANEVLYHGIDLSSTLIKRAQSLTKGKNCSFSCGDITEPLFTEKKSYTHASFLFSLQNVERADLALKEASKHMVDKGTLALVLNHPCFRIPRQSSWQIDEGKKMQYRRIDRYLCPLKIPITAHPGKKESGHSFSFHHSLSDLSRFLYEAGFSILLLEEWISDKKSTGKHAKMEDRARSEFPLFLAIKAIKRA